MLCVLFNENVVRRLVGLAVIHVQCFELGLHSFHAEIQVAADNCAVFCIISEPPYDISSHVDAKGLLLMRGNVG